MKKLTALLLTAVLLLSLAGCGSDNAGNNSASPSGGQSQSPATGAGGEAPEPLVAGVVQLADNGAFTDMRQGFISRMRELGYSEEQLKFEEKNAQGDMTNLNTICQELADEKVDFIVTIATPAAQAMVNLESGIPVFFISVSNPVGAGIITDMAKPDKLATGTSNAIPVEEIFNLADKLTPGLESFGILYNTGEVNAVTTAANAKAYLESQNIRVEEAVVTTSSEVQQAAQNLADNVEAIFVPNDSLVQSAMPQVAQVAKEAKIPVYGSSAVMVESGAFATISISDQEIGSMTADMTDRYLKGTAIEDIPAIVVSDFTTVINKATADAIGAQLSQEVLSSALLVEQED
ncbi:MAG: ABC transporter substrate-binding protein [Peptococcaceae bacterium]|nr:ABC transporter substrate-binding protein [Peptococcaceae bacterium]